MLHRQCFYPFYEQSNAVIYRKSLFFYPIWGKEEFAEVKEIIEIFMISFHFQTSAIKND